MCNFLVIGILPYCLFYGFSFGSIMRNEHLPDPQVGEGVMYPHCFYSSLSCLFFFKKISGDSTLPCLEYIGWDMLKIGYLREGQIWLTGLPFLSPPLCGKRQRCSWRSDLKFFCLLTELSLHLWLWKWENRLIKYMLKLERIISGTLYVLAAKPSLHLA